MPDTLDSAIGLFQLVIKLGFLAFGLLFILFGVLLVRQVKVMTETVHDPFNPKLKLTAWAYLALTIIVFIFLIFYL